MVAQSSAGRVFGFAGWFDEVCVDASAGVKTCDKAFVHAELRAGDWHHG